MLHTRRNVHSGELLPATGQFVVDRLFTLGHGFFDADSHPDLHVPVSLGLCPVLSEYPLTSWSSREVETCVEVHVATLETREEVAKYILIEERMLSATCVRIAELTHGVVIVPLL